MLSLSFILPALQVLSLIAGAQALPTSRSVAPLVTIDYGTFQGFSSAVDTESFLGIPFAQPPIGQLRFNNPLPPESFSGIRYATEFGNACPQQIPAGFDGTGNSTLSRVIQYISQFYNSTALTNASEDCLYLNVVRPAGASEGAGLPVIIWIYGGNTLNSLHDVKLTRTKGGFETGFASVYNGTQIASRSLALKSPVIYVSFNYRVNAYGFLGGKELKAAGLGNFGLQDQRLALKWVQKYIHLFGGNPQQVVLWGQSAGSMSVIFQMVAYDGQSDGLFQGAFMESGSVISSPDITSRNAQDGYDFLVQQTNCTAANDTLSCLRQAPYESVQNAVLKSPSIFSYQGSHFWGPLVDGIFLRQSSRESLRQGKYARVPAILGDDNDEGTLFSLTSLNVTTNEQFLEYMRTSIIVGATEEEIQKVAMLYPEDPALGSPFDVGMNDSLTPQYKRIATLQGDLLFQAPRRYTLDYLSRTQYVWSYLWKRNKQVPILGSFHGSDIQEFYDMTGNSDWVGADALVNFAYNLDPNVPYGGYPSGAVPSLLANIYWPQYERQKPQLLTFEDPNVLILTNDTFRTEQFETLDEIQCRLGL